VALTVAPFGVEVEEKPLWHWMFRVLGRKSSHIFSVMPSGVFISTEDLERDEKAIQVAKWI
jgi:hypothetical protein